MNRVALTSHLHLRAVLPAVAELPAARAEARELARNWHLPVRFALRGGPATVVRPPGLHGDGSPLTLLFFTPRQVNRTFANLPTPPPLPLGPVWRAAGLRPFLALTKLLQRTLEPTPVELAAAPPEFLDAHLRLTFGVLLRALPVVGSGDGPARAALAHAPVGTVAIEAPALDLLGWTRWDGRGELVTAPGACPVAPDATLRFTDRATLADALAGRLDPLAAVALGRVEVRGRVPLADAVGVVMDRVEHYLKPGGSPPSRPARV